MITIVTIIQIISVSGLHVVDAHQRQAVRGGDLQGLDTTTNHTTASTTTTATTNNNK